MILYMTMDWKKLQCKGRLNCHFAVIGLMTGGYGVSGLIIDIGILYLMTYGDKIVLAPERKKEEPEKEVPEQPEEKKDSVKDKGKSEPTQGTVKKEVDKKEAGTSSKKESASKADKDDSKKAVKK